MRVLRLELFEPRQIADIEAAVFAAPQPQRIYVNAVFAGELGNWTPSIGVL
ncbi:MAG: hypothetical protein WB681_01855 [Candidatus Cybelea sp.]